MSNVAARLSLDRFLTCLPFPIKNTILIQQL